MLFTEFSFAFLFLPIVLIVYVFLLKFTSKHAALHFLGLSSVLFYIWGDVRLLALLLASITINFGVGYQIFKTGNRAWVIFGVSFNIALIGVFKYADFLISTVNDLTPFQFGLLGIALPLGISFYTFQQIAFLLDMRQRPRQVEFWDYLLFVSFFPQLIAGPIVHHSEMMPQFKKIVGVGRQIYLSRFWSHLAVGLTIFIIGLFKKVVIADGCAVIATGMFDGVADGTNTGTISAWSGVLAYTFQIYFDFSGYSDMAIGIARMFGIKLPLNFFSPYKSGNIIEFWRRWHMTLSRWLRDYIYIPLGGSRNGPARRYVNLMTTMLIGGLWHGASWTFVAWGGLHGVFLTVNHIWNRFSGQRSLGPFGWFLTFFAVTNAWVLFRAQDFSTAMQIYSSMYIWSASDLADATQYWTIAGAFLVAVALPNTYEIMRLYRPVLEMPGTGEHNIRVGQNWPVYFTIKLWRPTIGWLSLTGALAAIYLYVISRSEAYVEFIYFQF